MTGRWPFRFITSQIGSGVSGEMLQMGMLNGNVVRYAKSLNSTTWRRHYREYLAIAARSNSMPKPGPVGTGNNPSASSFSGCVMISSI